MKRLNVILLAGIILFSTVFINSAFCNQNLTPQETTEENKVVDQEDAYSHESVLEEDLDSEYEDPQGDEVIRNDMAEEGDDTDYSETVEEGDEV